MDTIDTKKKIEKTCYIITVLLKISRVVCYVALGLIASAIVYVALKGDLGPLFQTGKITVMAPVSEEWMENLSKASIIHIFVVLIIKLILSAVMFGVAGTFFGDAGREGTPFVMKNVNRLRVVAILYFLVNMFDVSGKEIGDSLSVNLSGLVGAFIIWGISYMFEYGSKLQIESDETL
ncbi:MAG TPA: hypothetical protein VJY54_14760 [Lachnospiraceae bacterium]|nr:hypothetical protein [Lachnospiraceae bacterium]